jgi:hypothetical protein
VLVLVSVLGKEAGGDGGLSGAIEGELSDVVVSALGRAGHTEKRGDFFFSFPPFVRAIDFSARGGMTGEDGRGREGDEGA